MNPARTTLKVTDNVLFGSSGNRSFFALSLQDPCWESWQPGQFVMLRPKAWGSELAWARPFSICRVTARGLVLFFQVVGRGTARMAGLKVGDEVTIWGPLGNGFAVQPQKPTLLLAGGIGIAPFAAYVERHPAPDKLHMLFGHRLPSNYYPMDTLAQHINVENFREKEPADLKVFQESVYQRMRVYHEQGGLALACGPMPFLSMVWRYAAELGMPAQLSLENRMACGVGACLGCVASTTQHWPDKEKAGLPVQTCTNGPVFWADQIQL